MVQCHRGGGERKRGEAQYWILLTTPTYTHTHTHTHTHTLSLSLSLSLSLIIFSCPMNFL